MFSHPRRSWYGGVLIAACVLLLAVPGAVAGDGDPMQQIENLRQQLEQLEENALEDVAEDDFAMAHQWLDEAETRHRRGRSSGVEQRIRRVDHTLDLVRAQLDTVDIQRSIEQQHQTYENLVEQVENLREDIESLEKQKAERKEELERIRED